MATPGNRVLSWLSASLIVLALWLWLLTQTVHAQGPAKIVDIVPVLANIIKLLAPVAGIAFFIMLLIAGFQFVNSGGDPKAVGQARTTLTYAIIGVILVVASWLILALIQNITGVNVTEVNLPT